ncbi:DUF4277 domain-containing protein [Cylindrospermopsis raciborskii DSH]
MEIINELIESKKTKKVNAGQVVKAMIINGLGICLETVIYSLPNILKR